MARQCTCSWDTGTPLEFRDGQLSSLNQTADSVTKHTGGFALKMLQPGTALPIYWFTLTGITTYGRCYGRVWLYYSAAPAANGRAITFGTAAAAQATYGVMLKTDGTLQVASGTTGQGSASAALSVGWHLVEFSFNHQATTIDYELKVDDVAVSNGQTTVTLASGSMTMMGLGSPTAFGVGHAIYYDDFKLNDTTGSSETGYPNAGELLLMLPASDSAVGSGWTKPGGATTSLFSSVDNAPPVGITDSTSAANAEKQIRNPSSNSASYVATLQSYSTVGVTGTVNGIHSFAVIGAPTGSTKTGSLGLTGNPSQSAVSFGNYLQASAAGTFATGWKYVRSTYEALPAVTLGTGPTLSLNITGGTAANVALCCGMGAYVEWTPTVLTAGLFSNSTSFSAATVAPGSVNVAPGLTTNSQSFAAPTVASTYPLTPALVSNAPTFPAPVVATGPVDLAASLFAEANIFSAATVQPGAVGLVPGLLINSPTFAAPTVSSTAALIASLLTSSALISAPSVSGLYGLVPGLFTNSASFAAAVVAPGAANISPPLVPSAATFPAPTITGGAVSLLPSLLAANDTFPSATVTPGLVALTPPLVTNSPTIYASIAQSVADLRPGLLGSAVTFYAAAIQTGSPQSLDGALFENVSAFGVPVVGSTTALIAGLVTSQAVVFDPSVSLNDTYLVAELFANDSIILVPVVTLVLFGGRLHLPAEDRSITLPPENRHYILPREIRTEELASEKRRVAVPRAA